MSVRLSAATVLTGVSADAISVHTTSSGTDHALVLDNTVKSSHVGVNLLSGVSEVSAALSGSGAKKFKPTKIVVRVTAQTGAGATGDSHIQIGTSSGGSQILASHHMTGLVTVGQCYEVLITGLVPDIAGNATLFAQCTVPDSTGTTMTATVEVVGEQS